MADAKAIPCQRPIPRLRSTLRTLRVSPKLTGPQVAALLARALGPCTQDPQNAGVTLHTSNPYTGGKFGPRSPDNRSVDGAFEGIAQWAGRTVSPAMAEVKHDGEPFVEITLEFLEPAPRGPNRRERRRREP